MSYSSNHSQEIKSKINCGACAFESNQLIFDFQKMQLKTIYLISDFDLKCQIENPGINAIWLVAAEVFCQSIVCHYTNWRETSTFNVRHIELSIHFDLRMRRSNCSRWMLTHCSCIFSSTFFIEIMTKFSMKFKISMEIREWIIGN